MSTPEPEPWRDPERYKTGKLTSCHGCGNSCRKTHWGAWCYGCNVERIERINKTFADLMK
ncbi:hypothetical protein [Bradyrhizobium elkanii]|uniref:Uncharacterized protein n=1 Tax=Bradyrhizobium diazoefficiens TaxID=1355477 RepID=A0A809X610_9BRAD|nr:hypothetical protein XF1B_49140 [Bradyrhizobium diazoefficiens]BCE48498.1 hypothetical protein XF4B_48470 [Bradyrhizobium diazoefficiens]BCE92014.1 hypothetical protein XF10B_48120 [Bradyrhizobium diazoefficiens]BCF26942.1 hypothetical protein XF14B_48940 [Bradyrhizobium diazoefficiens]